MIGLFVHDKCWDDYTDVLEAHGYAIEGEQWESDNGAYELRICTGAGVLSDSVIEKLDALVIDTGDTQITKNFTSVADYTYLILWR